ncbi:MAG: shikimate kinase [Terracidiphilus sp.]
MTAPLQSQPAARPAPTLPPRRIVLTGFMGSGKSTAGPLLAQRLGWRFVDVDDVIEAEAGSPIAELFAREGEAAFREREHAAIARLATGGELVLALGGGAIEHQGTRSLLLDRQNAAGQDSEGQHSDRQGSASGTLLVHLEVELDTTLARCQGT